MEGLKGTDLFSSVAESAGKIQPREMYFVPREVKSSASLGGCVSWHEVLEQTWKTGAEPSSWCHWKSRCVALWEKGGTQGAFQDIHVHACLCIKHFSVLCPPTAVISAHPIHSLDNPHHHFHSGSLASPTRSYLHHQVSPWPIGTSISHSDRANSTGEIQISREILLVMEKMSETWKSNPETWLLWCSMKDRET